jgi:hypothetical protein
LQVTAFCGKGIGDWQASRDWSLDAGYQ